MNSVISLQEVSLGFPDGGTRTTVLDGVTMSASAGEVVAIIGPSGAGKSTLLAVASALVTPDSGRVLLSTESGTTDLATLSRSAATTMRRNEIGIVFQQSNLLSSLTAREQLEVMTHLGGGRAERKRASARAGEMLAAVGLADDQHKRPGALSGGQRQRVNIARALMNEPALLVVDEPTSALDTERGAEIIELLIDVGRSSNAATLLVTHDERHLNRMDACYRMVDGQLRDITEEIAAGGAVDYSGRSERALLR